MTAAMQLATLTTLVLALAGITLAQVHSCTFLRHFHTYRAGENRKWHRRSGSGCSATTRTDATYAPVA